ncbi:aldo/keto reductase [uncultured Bacteroides sp.]|uniref:aldo/keto reductase n=1 Tax=uncultured Bacteroides sp. TaxID=162156 RepID=UPI002674A6BB|nr:aldo/keto reductase [uncultured Bacteroides sp.]
MKTRKLGNLEVSAVGLGCMGFTHGYGACPNEEESIRLIRKAYEEGCTFFDTAEIYSCYKNEELVGKALKPFRDKVVISTKFTPATLPGQERPEGKLSRAGIRQAVEGSLRRLQTDYIDLYMEHRVPKESDSAEVAYWMGELIREGKIRAWGQSEPMLEQLRAAHAVTPITAVQSEYSIMERKWEADVIPFCRENGIGFVAYSPMAGGFLSGKYRHATFEGDDVRRVITRYTEENMQANAVLLDLINRYAEAKHCTAAQISLAWVMYAGHIVPIPGMRSDARILENIGASEVTLTDAEYASMNEALSRITIHGNRTDEDIAKLGTIEGNQQKVAKAGR